MKSRPIWVVVFALAATAAMAQEPVKLNKPSVPTTAPEPVVLPQQYTQEQLNDIKQRNPQLYEQIQRQALQMTLSHQSSFEKLSLPPLEVLYEHARNAPVMEYHALREEAAQREKKTVKRTWMKYFKLNANYQYGQLYMGTYDDTNPYYAPYWQYNNQRQHWWAVGASASFPLDEIFDRANKVKRQDLISQQSQYEAEAWFEEQKIKIIEAYTDAQMCLEMVKIKAENSTIATQIFRISQADFVNGAIDAQELSRQKGIQNVAVTEYEQVRARLYQAILKLEVLCNYKILNE